MQAEDQLPKPDQILNESLDKQRIVITGSRGTTSLAAMLVHVLSSYNRAFDYVITAAAHGITQTHRLSKAPIIIIESKPEDILQYQHHVGLITTIMWNSEEDPSEDHYVKPFDTFADSTPKGGILLYCENDPLATVIGAKPRTDVFSIGYKIHPHTSESGNHFLVTKGGKVPVHIYGSQNFQNISGAMELLKRLGITNEMFYASISNFPL